MLTGWLGGSGVNVGGSALGVGWAAGAQAARINRKRTGKIHLKVMASHSDIDGIKGAAPGTPYAQIF
jgi:hypothetical protein